MGDYLRCKMINGVKWYPKLINGNGNTVLMNVHKIEQLQNHLVICHTIEKENYTQRNFAYFDSYTDFYKFMLNIKQEERCYFEVIQGIYNQKPHFDVDINVKKIKEEYGYDYTIDTDFSERLKDCLIRNIIEKLENLGINASVSENILLYTSHGENKKSYHIVVNGYSHSNNVQAKLFRDSIVDLVKRCMCDDKDVVFFNKNGIDILSIFIDRSVYSSRQQFRIVSCQKYGSGRIKYFNEKFNYGESVITHDFKENFDTIELKQLKILSDSLVSFCVDCLRIPDTEIVKYNQRVVINDINDNYFNYAYTFVEKYYGVNTFSIRNIDHAKMTANLKTMKPYYCYVCSKVHEHENPRIYITGNTAYWNCRRSNKRIFLCVISIVDVQTKSNKFETDVDKKSSSIDKKAYIFNTKPDPEQTVNAGSGSIVCEQQNLSVWDNNIELNNVNTMVSPSTKKLPIVSSSTKKKINQQRDISREVRESIKKTTLDDVISNAESHIVKNKIFTAKNN